MKIFFLDLKRSKKKIMFLKNCFMKILGGECAVTFIIIGSGLRYLSSNPEQSCGIIFSLSLTIST